MDRLSVESDLPAIGALGSRQNFHQGALTGTILPHQSVNLTWPDREVHALKRTDAGETLRDPADGQDRFSRLATWSSLGTR
jgi:hypothetical protein